MVSEDTYISYENKKKRLYLNKYKFIMFIVFFLLNCILQINIYYIIKLLCMRLSIYIYKFYYVY